MQSDGEPSQKVSKSLQLPVQCPGEHQEENIVLPPGSLLEEVASTLSLLEVSAAIELLQLPVIISGLISSDN